MNIGNFIAVDLERCQREGHTLRTTFSDKTPMKMSLMCVDCSLETQRNAYVAYGQDKESWGRWRQRKREAEKDVENHGGLLIDSD